MKTETRIPYDEVALKYNPETESHPWEVWNGGELELAAATPREAFEAWASQTELIERYVDDDGEPQHEHHPDEYASEDVLAKAEMELDEVPSEKVQADLWNALKTCEEQFTLDEFCDATGADLGEARRATNLLAAHDLVGWGTSPNIPWLTEQGEAIDQPEWFEDSASGE